jgi:hypothetical protein
MSSITVALTVFTVVFGGALVGIALRSVLPEHHLSPESREIVKLSIGLIATMTALVLGLLVGSVKSSFDSKNEEFNRICSNLVVFDRTLAQYGPETKDIRVRLSLAVTARSEQLTERKTNRVTKDDAYTNMLALEQLQSGVRALQPASEGQRELKDRAMAVSTQIIAARWHLLGGVASSVPVPFLVVVVIWLAIIFLSFGLFAPSNSTVIAALFLAAISVAGALFLILEMDRPFDGLIHLSDVPLQHAAQFIGR